MKTMTCRELGGACDEAFFANTFEELGELSKAHSKEMFDKRDLAHLEALKQMGEMMKDSNSLIQWMQSKKEYFDNLPHIK